jgi:hypothetical protein
LTALTYRETYDAFGALLISSFIGVNESVSAKKWYIAFLPFRRYGKSPRESVSERAIGT